METDATYRKTNLIAGASSMLLIAIIISMFAVVRMSVANRDLFLTLGISLILLISIIQIFIFSYYAKQDIKYAWIRRNTSYVMGILSLIALIAILFFGSY